MLACLAKKKEQRPENAAALATMLAATKSEVGEWTREEARAWWAERARKSSSAPPQAKPTSEASVLGQTIAVALDDRRGAA